MQSKTLVTTLLIHLLIVLNPKIGFTQSEKKYTQVFAENFNDNKNHWYTFRSDQYQVFISQGGYYVLNRPLNSYYGYTRAGVPKELNQINEGGNSLLSFDAEILDANSNGDFCFGITFDWHETPDIDCRKREDNGGDFYLIKITGNKNTNVATANIIQRENCEDINLIKSLRNAELTNTNKIEIEKNNSTYNVIINGTVVTSFVYDAKFSFDNLYAERGRYAFDNFKIQRIHYEFSSQSGFVQNSQAAKPQIYMLLAGINHYNNPNYSVGQLTGPLKDITAMKNFYKSVGGGAIENTNIIFLPDEEATADNILKKSAELFSKANQNDVIITYLSGHGGVGYFCAYDQGLQYERLNLILNKSPARKIFIVDACHAGSWDVTSAMTSKGEKLTEQQALDLFYKQLTISGNNGINWLLACRPDEYSADGQNNGLFTEFLLSGLKGAADKEGNDDNIISLDEVYNYIKERFSVWNNQNRGRFWSNTNVPLKMDPVLKSSGNTNIPMAVRTN